MRVDVWVERLGTTSCVYGFVCSNESGTVGYARGERTIVKLDPASHRPAPWTDAFVEIFRILNRNRLYINYRDVKYDESVPENGTGQLKR